ncbi:MAG: hypothetical protein AMXMBFR81_19430 [Chthonomonas sp.]|nr:hypothetical protein [Fimbriimonadaceae bacterium]
MAKMDPKMVKEWKARYDALHEFKLEEARNMLPADRLAKAQALVNWLASTGRLAVREDDLEFHLRWQHARQKWLEKFG